MNIPGFFYISILSIFYLYFSVYCLLFIVPDIKKILIMKNKKISFFATYNFIQPYSSILKRALQMQYSGQRKTTQREWSEKRKQSSTWWTAFWTKQVKRQGNVFQKIANNISICLSAYSIFVIFSIYSILIYHTIL